MEKLKIFLYILYRTSRSIKLRERASPGSSPKAGPSCDDSVEVTGAGYNSGDEYDTRRIGNLSEAEWLEVN